MWEWVQLSDASHNSGTGARKLTEAENKTAKRELGVFCSGLLEVHEDELIAAIREGTQTGTTLGMEGIYVFGFQCKHLI